MKQIFLLILSLSFLNYEQKPSMIGEFRGFWATTWWTLELQQDNKFKFTSWGHFGNTETLGTFKIDEPFIELEPKDESSLKEIFKNYKFKILGDSCLVDLDHGYDYCRTRPEQWCSRTWNLNKNKIIEDCLE